MLNRLAIHIALLLLSCCTGWLQGYAQSGIYIPKKAKVFLNSDTVTFFDNVINHGSLGIAKNAVVHFTGTQWQNAPDAHITNETDTATGSNGQGGQVRFGGTQRQQLDGAYNAATKSGPMFSGLAVDNPSGIALVNSNTKIAQELLFLRGHVYIQHNVLVVGNGHPGRILGYNENRFVVTGNTAGSGLLLREGISTTNGTVAFPVGTRAGSYTPVAVRLRSGQPDDFYANVFSGVLTRATTGGGLVDEGVDRTWELGKMAHPGSGNVEVTLQHRNSDEGFYFSRNRQGSYLSTYNGLHWDTVRGAGAPVVGYLTTGAALANSGVNLRIFDNAIGHTAYFTKFTAGQNSTHQTELTLHGYRIDQNLVNINWGTQPEVNVRHFVVQRRLSTETGFQDVGTVRSTAAGAISYGHLFYQINNPNAYTGVSYYKLQLVQLNGDISYSQTIAVGGTPGRFNMMLWPNPSAGQFQVSINTTLPVHSVAVWDVWGQKLREEPVAGRRIIKMHLSGLANGIYYVGIISPAGALLGTEQLMLIRN